VLITTEGRTEAIWFARFSSVERSSPGGFWDLGIGATVGGFEEPVRGRFLGVIVVVWILKCFDDSVVEVEVDVEVEVNLYKVD
jgi:hypothetical protein